MLTRSSLVSYCSSTHSTIYISVLSQDNHGVEAAQLQYDVDALQRRADGAKMKLTAEMKVRRTDSAAGSELLEGGKNPS